MARIDLKNLAHSYLPNPAGESDYALSKTDHVWEDGGAYALLGPSGCGKTTLLNIISGLLQPSEGQVFFDGRDVTSLLPQERNIAQVFQFPVIYDTMSVYDNLAFPLRNRKVPQKEIHERVNEVAEMLELQGDLKKRAANLSADAKQKISLGRGLVRSDVAAVLFDEPLTVIDPHLKLLLRRKLKQIHAQFKLTMVYVTHDQLEALTFADKVVVMNEGKVLQIGTPQDLFENPQHTFVGHFIGSPGMNFLNCKIEKGMAKLGSLEVLACHDCDHLCGNFELGIRPEFIKLSATAGENTHEVKIIETENLGNCRIVTVELAGQKLKVKLQEDQEIPEGQGFIEFPLEWIRLYAEGHLVAQNETTQEETVA
ncbi:ABC transporter ATP-binding protein [uncultured Desulfuromusa sp.]|uniref:ABC transporter ATP-binding protein n=1 Tax=uncultured Desulfuromusa sp. TaxID=219183 RepID=UPI002AA7AA83|nr:ABC transporter ATP-binding protein [uncultured Desulfuromusa sp.]